MFRQGSNPLNVAIVWCRFVIHVAVELLSLVNKLLLLIRYVLIELVSWGLTGFIKMDFELICSMYSNWIDTRTPDKGISRISLSHVRLKPG